LLFGRSPPVRPHSPKAVGRRGHVRDAGGNVGLFGGGQPDARPDRAGAGRREAYVERARGNRGGAPRGVGPLVALTGSSMARLGGGATVAMLTDGPCCGLVCRSAWPVPLTPLRVRWRTQLPSNGVLLHRRPSRSQPKRSRARAAARRRGLSCGVASPFAPLLPIPAPWFPCCIVLCVFYGIFAQVLSSRRSPVALCPPGRRCHGAIVATTARVVLGVNHRTHLCANPAAGASIPSIAATVFFGPHR